MDIEYSRLAGILRKFSQRDRELVSRLKKDKTAAEDQLWQLIRKDRISGVRFRRQHKIGRFVVDFFSIKYKLAIEVDGEIHAFQVEKDAARTEWLNSLGIRIIRFSNADVMNQSDRVLTEIEKAFREQQALFP